MEAFKILGIVDLTDDEPQGGRPQRKIILKNNFQWFLSEQCKELMKSNTMSNSVGKDDDLKTSPSKSDTVPLGQSPCYTCGSTKFWKTKDGSINCASCHPPTSENEVMDWIEI